MRLSGNHASRIFVVNTGVTAALDRLTLFNGQQRRPQRRRPQPGHPDHHEQHADDQRRRRANGGAIGNLGTLTIANSTVWFNTAGIDGGGIWNSGSGTVTIRNSTISGNTATTHWGGGIASSGGTR